MAYLNPRVLDYGLNELYTNGTRLDVCNARPVTYTEATDYFSIGYRLSLPRNPIADGSVSGRRIVYPGFSDGVGTANDTGTHYAITDPVNERLLAVAEITGSIVIVDAEAFTLPQFEIAIPGVS